jgi:hypothetical protein
MSVQELIDRLNQVQDKSKPVTADDLRTNGSMEFDIDDMDDRKERVVLFRRYFKK